MKAVKKVVVLMSLALLAPFAALADTVEQAYLDTCRKEPGVPVPIAVVSPAVGAEYTGEQVDIEFIVSEAGRPESLAVKSAVDETIASAVVDAVKRWRFKPAEKNGVAVATKVLLPVKVVDASAASLLAAN